MKINQPFNQNIVSDSFQNKPREDVFELNIKTIETDSKIKDLVKLTHQPTMGHECHSYDWGCTVTCHQ